MTYVGIDQSYSGFAVTLLKETGHNTTVASFPPAKYSCDGERLFQIGEYLCNALGPIPAIKGVVMEGYAMGSKFGREKAGELGGVVKTELWSHGLVPNIVTPSALKKFVLGPSAGKGKNLMLLGVYKKWSAEFSNDNAADSFACAKVAQMLDHPDATEFKYERDVLNVIRKAA